VVPAIATLVSTLIAALMAASAPALLRWPPAPEDEPGGIFSDLGTRRFRLVLAGVCLASGVATLATTAPVLWPVWAPLVALGPLLGLIDAHTTFLPLRLNYLALALVTAGVAVSCWLRADWWPALLAVAGGAGATAFYALVWWLSRGQLGFGDVRLAGLLGVAAGATSLSVLVQTFVLGSLIGAVWAIISRLRGRRDGFAYGPSMLIGAPAALLLGAAVGAWG
jgi:leader peptidase (prepilin peptidase)/N-methyltransferase